MTDKNESLIAWLNEGILCNEEYGFSGNVLAAMKIALEFLTRDEAAERREWMARGVELSINKLKALGDKSYAPYELECLLKSIRIGSIHCDL